MVTPLAGVWIEIPCGPVSPFRPCVTPLAGVWIEISGSGDKGQVVISHSPCGSVDWNNHFRKRGHGRHVSLPLRECGLKYECVVICCTRQSHSPCGSVDWNFVSISTLSTLDSHSPCGSVDWNNLLVFLNHFQSGHSPCGSVDWNIIENGKNVIEFGHSPCGSVDWNCTPDYSIVSNAVSLPLRECGLKYMLQHITQRAIWSLPLRECGLK